MFIRTVGFAPGLGEDVVDIDLVVEEDLGTNGDALKEVQPTVAHE